MSWSISAFAEIHSLVCEEAKVNRALRETETCTIEASGNAGADGRNGASGMNGSNGVSGSRGGDGSRIEVLLVGPSGCDKFFVSQGLGSRTTALPLLASKSSMQLLSLGGAGGDGGHGGNGCHGYDGSKGYDATKSTIGTDGGRGGAGGDGGNGGHGGNGGNGGDIVVNTSVDDVDLLLSIDGVNVKGGRGGNGGSGGAGGQGGRGGQGGAGLTWQTRVYDSYNSNYHTEYHSKPGGCAGANGPNGSNGRCGQAGADGVSGKYTIRVHDMKARTVREYSRIFCLHPKYTGRVDASDMGGNIEPGQVVSLCEVGIHNTGGMPSPAMINNNEDGICVRLVDNNLVSMLSESSVILPVAINPSCDYFLPNGFKCLVHRAKPNITADAPPFQYNVDFKLAAHSTRLRRVLTDFARPPVTVTVQYPVLFAAIRGGRTGLAGDFIPFAAAVQNIANIELGSAAPRPRLVRVRMTLRNSVHVKVPAGIVFRTSGTAVDQTYKLGSGPVFFDIPNLGAKATELISGTIMCSPGSLDAYWAAVIEISLVLGDIDAPTDPAKLFVAQNATHTFQIVEECTGFANCASPTGSLKSESSTSGFGSELPSPVLSPTSNLLLVMNATTSMDEITAWKSFAASVRLNLVCYDAAYYNGFDYNMEMVNVLSEVRDGVVIILNHAYYRNDDPAYFNKFFYVDQFLRTSAIFEAARRLSVRTYVINGNPNLTMRQLAYPSEPHTTVVQHSSRTAFTKSTVEAPFSEVSERLETVYDEVSVSSKRVLFSPKEKGLVHRSGQLEAELSKVRPDRTYFTIERFEKEKVSTSFLFVTKYRLGSVECRRGLDSTSALIGMWDLTAGPGTTLAHSFAVLKLLPFEKKLALLCDSNVANNETVGATLVDATLSDIADEVSLYVIHKRDFLFSGIPSAQMAQCMLRLARFTTFDRFPDSLLSTLLAMCKRLDTLFQRISTKWGLTHPYARHLTESLHRMVSRLFPDRLSEKVTSAKFLAQTSFENAQPVDKSLGVRATLNTMRNPLGLGALTFNNSVALESDPPVLAVNGLVGSGRPLFKFKNEDERVQGVAEFMKVVGMVSTHKRVVNHRGTL